MPKRTPIKRVEEMKPVSRDHHQGLLLCFKIRKGLEKGVELSRIKNYCDWFYKEHIIPHFEIEEKYVFPVLGEENELVQKALAQHKRLRSLFEDKDNPGKSLPLLKDELDDHIRFEERVLFNKIQDIASEEQLKTIEKVHPDEDFCEKTGDEFWK